ncbi:MAG: hypothetical protein F6K44_31770 [Moorea sp. SIO3E2]|nr:hypothetical protein [Moorena sp. SIO3B2]NEQ10259.1 hypothetical protein [Moorena sp. SIO4E2]NEQ18019.1 hypothetical protein [Moorena sp. SIO3E2]NER86653.1 hypothetical protein [Moorena sp. SIO3A2]NES43709.1 hypothetical protein [Moorena sp. SIO2C4]
MQLSAISFVAQRRSLYQATVTAIVSYQLSAISYQLSAYGLDHSVEACATLLEVFLNKIS